MGEKVLTQDKEKRIHNFDEVELGFAEEQAIRESKRCLKCKNPKCIEGCPVRIDIPAFIKELQNKNNDKALEIIKNSNNLPGVCGRVCPQESQCQGKCILNAKKDPISIGRLERYAFDHGKEPKLIKPKNKNKKVAIVGSGPAGLTCAADLAKLGYEVTIFEAFQKPGGVLIYGIPAFRLPKKIIENEVQKILSLGVKLKLNYVAGKTITLDELKKDFDAVFIGVGAGLPQFLGILGENLNGAITANEYLTRVNLMKSYMFPKYETPIQNSKKTVVVGGGNVAMDAARSARRLGADVIIVYRRSFEEMPARLDEIHHAEEEGIKFQLLTNPTKIIGKTNVEGIECLKMRLGVPDESGRRKPIPIQGSEFIIECDQVIVAIGRAPNQILIKDTNLNRSKRGNLIVNGNLQANDPKVFAGGDIVRGETTVIDAMGDGKKAAVEIDKILS